eukprot:3260049-Rhodomonas_salina.3
MNEHTRALFSSTCMLEWLLRPWQAEQLRCSLPPPCPYILEVDRTQIAQRGGVPDTYLQRSPTWYRHQSLQYRMSDPSQEMQRKRGECYHKAHNRGITRSGNPPQSLFLCPPNNPKSDTSACVPGSNCTAMMFPQIELHRMDIRMSHRRTQERVVGRVPRALPRLDPDHMEDIDGAW